MIDYKQFERICAMSKAEILEEGVRLGGTITEAKANEVYLHIDRNSPVLGIAHMDFVYDESFHFHKIDVGGIPYVLCPRLDDRIGIYTLFHHLPALGLNFDILITDNEESGKSTGQYFESERQYNWMFQFDRRKEDVVHYMYDEDFLKKRLKRAGFIKLERGSASDISKMEHMKCCGFNVGTGYEDEHSLWAMADMDMYERQVQRFVDFYTKFHTLHFRYEKKVWKTPSYTTYQYPPLPPGGKRVYEPGYAWSNQHTCYMPIHDKEETVTSPPPKAYGVCISCHTLLNDINLSFKFSNLCYKCEPQYFLCIGCNTGHRVSFQRERDLCESCSTLLAQEGQDNFFVQAKCKESGCTSMLSYYEYTHGGVCDPCSNNLYPLY